MRRGAAGFASIVAAVVGLCAAVACSDLGNLTGGDDPNAGDAASDGTSDSAANVDGALPNGDPTLDEACSAYAETFCARLTACAPALVQQQWGGPATCESHARTACVGELGVPGVTLRP